MYFLERLIGEEYPPPITHPEFFYGFLGVAIAWQVVFVMIGRDPVRYRPIMIAGVLEKVSYGLAAISLFWLGRIGAGPLLGGILDLGVAVLFVMAFRRTPHSIAYFPDAGYPARVPQRLFARPAFSAVAILTLALASAPTPPCSPFFMRCCSRRFRTPIRRRWSS